MARALRDAGMEVVYLEGFLLPSAVVKSALQEDVDVIGISILSGAPAVLLPKVLAQLREAQADNVLLIAGGIFPDEDIPRLKAAGVAEVFRPNTPLEDIVRFITDHVRQNK